MPDTNEITVADATQTTINRLRELLSDQIEEWRIDREPHKYRDGTNHFTHVRYTAYDCDGTPMPVEVGSYLTDDLAELLVTAKNNLPELLRLAAIGLKAEDAKR